MILYAIIRVILICLGIYCLIAGAPADACALFLLTIVFEQPQLRFRMEKWRKERR